MAAVPHEHLSDFVNSRLDFSVAARLSRRPLGSLEHGLIQIRKTAPMIATR